MQTRVEITEHYATKYAKASKKVRDQIRETVPVIERRKTKARYPKIFRRYIRINELEVDFLDVPKPLNVLGGVLIGGVE